MIQALKNIKRKAVRFFQTPQQRRHALVGPAHLWKMKQDFQISFLKTQGLAPDHKFMDIGCGTLRGGIPLIDFLEQGNYCGIEVRDAVLQEGKNELAEHGLQDKNPQLICFKEFSELSFNNKFDVLFAFSVLIHMKDEIVEKCIAFISSVIADSGAFYANVNIVSYSDNNWQGFPVVFRSMEFYENLAKKNGLTVSAVGTLAELGHISGQELGDKQVMLCFKKQ
ncbi:MAG: hypothetical protein CL853_03860 [Crocinitomicaceae bacterium]|nr:hypothetical protein [Crocinitomicaceae bacterium]|tara:strand:+ start:213 stop:884 length:672 start_codon:yes stop_codon:yes gene_type:complete